MTLIIGKKQSSSEEPNTKTQGKFVHIQGGNVFSTYAQQEKRTIVDFVKTI